MNVFLGIVCLLIGIWVWLDPETALRWEDIFRIKGAREYSEVAIFFMRARAILALVCGIALFFIKF